jgi:hypothetical protein
MIVVLRGLQDSGLVTRPAHAPQRAASVLAGLGQMAQALEPPQRTPPASA